MTHSDLIGDVRAGEKSNFRYRVGEMNDGTELTVPVMIARGLKDGPTVFLSGASHGDEYNGPATIQRLLNELETGDLRGTLVGVPIMNPLAFFTRTRMITLDYEHYNMNRIFPGASDDLLSLRMTFTIFDNLVSRADYAIDFHEGGLPFIARYLIADGTAEAKEKVGNVEAQMGRWFGNGIPLLDRTTSREHLQLGRGGTLSEACGREGIPVLNAEMGGGLQIHPEYVETTVTGVRNILKGLEMLSGEMANTEQIQAVADFSTWPRPNHGGFLKATPAAMLGVTVTKGTHLASIFDVFGEEIEQIVAPFDSVILDIRTMATVYPGDWTYHCGRLA